MKVPLWCYECDALVGHEIIIPFKGECVLCGNVRKLPILRWIVLFILLMILIGLPVYYFAMWTHYVSMPNILRY